MSELFSYDTTKLYQVLNLESSPTNSAESRSVNSVKSGSMPSTETRSINYKIQWVDGMDTKTKDTIINELINKLIGKSPSAIEKIIASYGDLVLIDMIIVYIKNDIIIKNLSHIMPKTDINIIFNLVKAEIPVETIENLSDRININATSNDNDTCLYRVTNMKYLIKLLSSNKLDFDLNHRNQNGLTFYRYHLTKSNMNAANFKEITNILAKKNYVFDADPAKLSILDIIVLTKREDHMCDIITIEQFDITRTILWLHLLIRQDTHNDFRNLLIKILNRTDYESFLYKIMHKYAYEYAHADKHIIYIMTLFKEINRHKLIKMIEYQNDKGNTIVHTAASYHLDRIIRFVTSEPCLESSLEKIFNKNVDGKTPLDLYVDNSVPNILKKYSGSI